MNANIFMVRFKWICSFCPRNNLHFNRALFRAFANAQYLYALTSILKLSSNHLPLHCDGPLSVYLPAVCRFAFTSTRSYSYAFMRWTYNHSDMILDTYSSASVLASILLLFFCSLIFQVAPHTISRMGIRTIFDKAALPDWIECNHNDMFCCVVCCTVACSIGLSHIISTFKNRTRWMCAVHVCMSSIIGLVQMVLKLKRSSSVAHMHGHMECGIREESQKGKLAKAKNKAEAAIER